MITGYSNLSDSLFFPPNCNTIYRLNKIGLRSLIYGFPPIVGVKRLKIWSFIVVLALSGSDAVKATMVPHFPTQTLDPEGRVTLADNDKCCRKISDTNRDNEVTEYEYDLNDN